MIFWYHEKEKKAFQIFPRHWNEGWSGPELGRCRSVASRNEIRHEFFFMWLIIDFSQIGVNSKRFIIVLCSRRPSSTLKRNRSSEIILFCCSAPDKASLCHSIIKHLQSNSWNPCLFSHRRDEDFQVFFNARWKNSEKWHEHFIRFLFRSDL